MWGFCCRCGVNLAVKLQKRCNLEASACHLTPNCNESSGHGGWGGSASSVGSCWKECCQTPAAERTGGPGVAQFPVIQRTFDHLNNWLKTWDKAAHGSEYAWPKNPDKLHDKLFFYLYYCDAHLLQTCAFDQGATGVNRGQSLLSSCCRWYIKGCLLFNLSKLSNRMFVKF